MEKYNFNANHTVFWIIGWSECRILARVYLWWSEWPAPIGQLETHTCNRIMRALLSVSVSLLPMTSSLPYKQIMQSSFLININCYLLRYNRLILPLYLESLPSSSSFSSSPPLSSSSFSSPSLPPWTVPQTSWCSSALATAPSSPTTFPGASWT